VTLEELEERLQLLLDGKAITTDSHQIAIQAFEELQDKLDQQEIAQAEMLFTHLPMALMRIEEGEDVEGPNQDIMDEIKQSEHFHLSEDIVAYVEKLWNNALPQEEKDFLYMHITNIININSGGIKS